MTEIVFSHLERSVKKTAGVSFGRPHRLFQIFSNNSRDSFSRFFCSSSMRTRLKLLQAMTNMIAVTSLKHWIHFRRSSCCPPTSNILQREREKRPCVWWKHFQALSILTESEHGPPWRWFRRCLRSEHDNEEYPRERERGSEMIQWTDFSSSSSFPDVTNPLSDVCH